jgi:hypothetical protein
MARDVVHQLLATDVALDKLVARGISAGERGSCRATGTSWSETLAEAARETSDDC